MDVVNCKKLDLSTERLNKDETEALVRAMRSRVEILSLITFTDWQMDYDTFSKYKGDGKCREVHIIDNHDHISSSLLDSVHCEKLHLFNRSKELNKDETEALVRAMISRVEIVFLGESQDGVYKDPVCLDFETLKMYKGDGKCKEVHCNRVAIGWSWFDGYRDYCDIDEDEYEDLISAGDGFIMGKKDKWLDDERAETWAEQMNWDIEVKIKNCEFLLSRKKKV